MAAKAEESSPITIHKKKEEPIEVPGILAGDGRE